MAYYKYRREFPSALCMALWRDDLRHINERTSPEHVIAFIVRPRRKTEMTGRIALRLFERGFTIKEIARIWKITPPRIAHALRIARLMTVRRPTMRAV